MYFGMVFERVFLDFSLLEMGKSFNLHYSTTETHRTMNLINNTRRNLLMLLMLFSFGAIQAQNVQMTDVAGVHTISIEKETAPDLDWGETKQGVAVRARVEFTNTLDEPVTLVRVIAEQGCYPVGNRLALRDVKVEPGKTQDFFVIAKGDVVGQQTYKVELILEDEEGKRSRMGVFQFLGSVVAGE